MPTDEDRMPVTNKIVVDAASGSWSGEIFSDDGNKLGDILVIITPGIERVDGTRRPDTYYCKITDASGGIHEANLDAPAVPNGT